MCDKWDKIKKNLQKSLKSGTFELWIKNLHGEYADGVLFLKAPNSFVADWVKKKLLFTIKKTALDVLGLEDLEIIIDAPKDGNELIHKRRFLPFVEKFSKPKNDFLWRYTFEDFVVGMSNELAYNVCNMLCKNRNITDRLFLFSTSGLGKTHLLHAIGDYYHRNGKDRAVKVLYISSDYLANLMVQAIKNGSFSTFKEIYTKDVDILLLEDIHFFQGKYKMQEELLSIIKILENHGKNVVFTSSFMPKELKKVDSQLTSYFCSGLIISIDNPDIELRLKIINKELKNSNLRYSQEICEYIAKHITTDIRQLKSCVQNIVFKASILNKKIIDFNLVKDVVKNYKSNDPDVDLKDIVDLVCKAFKLPFDALKSKSRKKELVVARNTAFYLAKRFTSLSLKDIGKFLNRRHSTVLKGITSIEMEIKKDSSIGRQAQEIAKKIENKDF